jgi:hypothetical protein
MYKASHDISVWGNNLIEPVIHVPKTTLQTN